MVYYNYYYFKERLFEIINEFREILILDSFNTVCIFKNNNAYKIKKVNFYTKNNVYRKKYNQKIKIAHSFIIFIQKFQSKSILYHHS